MKVSIVVLLDVYIRIISTSHIAVISLQPLNENPSCVYEIKTIESV